MRESASHPDAMITDSAHLSLASTMHTASDQVVSTPDSKTSSQDLFRKGQSSLSLSDYIRNDIVYTEQVDDGSSTRRWRVYAERAAKLGPLREYNAVRALLEGEPDLKRRRNQALTELELEEARSGIRMVITVGPTSDHRVVLELLRPGVWQTSSASSTT